MNKELHEYLPRTLEVTVIEELAELQQAISKIVRYGVTRDNYNNLVEEIADVTLMIGILMQKYDVSEKEVEKNRKFKIKRLAERITEDIRNTGGSL